MPGWLLQEVSQRVDTVINIELGSVDIEIKRENYLENIIVITISAFHVKDKRSYFMHQ